MKNWNNSSSTIHLTLCFDWSADDVRLHSVLQNIRIEQVESISYYEHIFSYRVACALLRTESAQALKVHCMGRIPYPNHTRI
jgi:hypothetical protein